MRKKADPAVRFWAKVVRGAEAECWPWIAAKNPDGYGRFQTGNTTQERAHRFSYALANGPIPVGMHVLHRCDNPPCVNPAHLFLGTNEDNWNDKISKRRHAHGSYRTCAKVNETQVVEIRALRAAKVPVSDIASKFGVSETVVYKIIEGRTWRHVA